MEKKKLIAVDGYGILFKSFFALPELVNSENVPVGAIHGSVKIMLNLLSRYNDCHFIVALDGAGRTFRQLEYEKYKANRAAPPDALLPQFDMFDEMLAAMGIAAKRIAGYEADDIIASYVHVAKGQSYNSVVVSADKDLMQLIDGDVEYYHTSLKTVFSSTDVKKKFGVLPEQLVDYLSLVGDASDNIPGVRSVGPKTATNLINKYGTLEEIYDSIDNVENVRLRQALVDGRELAFLSKKLVTLIHNIEDLHWKDLSQCKGVDYESLKGFLTKYDLRDVLNMVIKRENKDNVDNGVKNDSDKQQHNFDF